jgi:hypothetical protein
VIVKEKPADRTMVRRSHAKGEIVIVGRETSVGQLVPRETSLDGTDKKVIIERPTLDLRRREVEGN